MKQLPQLKPKHEVAAMLLAAGELTHKEVAEKVGLSSRGLDKVKTWSDFRQLVQYYRDMFLGSKEEGIRARVMEDAIRNYEFLTNTRDGNFSDGEKVMSIRLKACQMLWDRQMPKREDVDTGGVTIVINADVAKRMQTAEAFAAPWAWWSCTTITELTWFLVHRLQNAATDQERLSLLAGLMAFLRDHLCDESIPREDFAQLARAVYLKLRHDE
jgi:hypothetical protein